MEKIAYCEDATTTIEAALTKNGYSIRKFSEPLSSEDYEKVEIVLGNPPKEELERFCNLRFMQLRSAGANGYDDESLYRAVQEKNMLKVSTAQGIFNRPIAEYCIGMMCLLGKKLISEYIYPKVKIFGGEEEKLRS